MGMVQTRMGVILTTHAFLPCLIYMYHSNLHIFVTWLVAMQSVLTHYKEGVDKQVDHGLVYICSHIPTKMV